MKSSIFIASRMLLMMAINLLFSLIIKAQVTILDSRHDDAVIREMAHFRIFLPNSYSKSPQKKYPVIYFLHGWSQRYFGSGEDSYAAYDSGWNNSGDNIEKFVSENEVIVVKSDGYNRSANEEYYKRPYNVGPVETYRQFPIYFEELINYIDDSYNTFNDRNHRAITGLSMGGFMAMLIGGKYPHLFSAIGSFCPSAEFMIGPKDFPVEYRLLDMHNNYPGTNVILHYGDKDFIRSYHEDRNKIWTQVLDNYKVAIYPGEHSTVGLGDMFTGLLNTFKKPPKKPLKWDHIDFYPNFSVWDYQINSDRNSPGFTILENVDTRGFKSSIRNFLPDGEYLSYVNMSILTPPIYARNALYIINDFDEIKKVTTQKEIWSDNMGRIKIRLNGSKHNIGINKAGDIPNISLVAFKIENMAWATHNKEVELSVELINKGLVKAKNIKASIYPVKPVATLIKSQSIIGDLAVNEFKSSKTPFVFKVNEDSLDILKFKLIVQDGNGNEWSDFFEVELKKELPGIVDFEIADGRKVTVAKSGNEKETVTLGTGNGDGIANPGESIVLLARDQDQLWRTQLFYTDKYINPFGVSMRSSDTWENFDYVGGSAKYSIPMIASVCPKESIINFYASYWIPAAGRTHIVKHGKISIPVKGKDNTPPILEGVEVPGDNIIQARIIDGTVIAHATATLSMVNNPEQKITVELIDNGKDGDRVAADNYFSNRVPTQKFGIYKIKIEATDLFGNKMQAETQGTVVLH